MNRLIYVASAYSEFYDDRVWEALKIAKEASKIVRDNGDIPLSPVLAFHGVYENKNKDEVMQKCFCLLRCCEGVFVANHKSSNKSKGIKEELEFANKHNIPVIQYDLMRFDTWA